LSVYREIRLELADGVGTVTLDRPEKLNAYTPRMGEELVDAFRRLRDDPGARAVILTGAGRGFCAGVDLDLLRAHRAADAAPPEGSAGAPRLGEEEFVLSFPAELHAFPKPVIAAIHGPAIGVGVTMTLPCDLRLAAEGAKLGLTFTRLGLLPGLGSTFLLPRLVGMARALELVLTARVLEASEAARLGLVSEVVPTDRLLPRARELAGALAELRPEVLAAAKRALLYGARASLEEALRNEQRESAGLRQRR
jgi:2-(1,2-epoxy-1,2-dihydrophenyl)acetyl-CoA isomerase